MNYVPFAEGVVELVVELYKETAKHLSVVNEHVLQHIIAVSNNPGRWRNCKFFMFILQQYNRALCCFLIESKLMVFQNSFKRKTVRVLSLGGKPHLSTAGTRIRTQYLLAQHFIVLRFTANRSTRPSSQWWCGLSSSLVSWLCDQKWSCTRCSL